MSHRKFGWKAWLVPFFPIVIVISDEIRSLLYGKRICIIGERKVGKTMFINYLINGKMHTSYRATQHTIRTKGSCLSLGDLNLYIKDSVDVSGGTDGRGEWEKSFNNSDYVMYLFRADLIYPSILEEIVPNLKNTDSDKHDQFISIFNGYLDANAPDMKRLSKNSAADTIHELSLEYDNYREAYKDRFKDDIELINEWQKPKKKPIVYIGTHGDLIPKFNYKNSIEGIILEKIQKKIREDIREMSQNDRQNIIVGTFTTKTEFELYIAEAFKLLVNRTKQI